MTSLKTPNTSPYSDNKQTMQISRENNKTTEHTQDSLTSFVFNVQGAFELH